MCQADIKADDDKLLVEDGDGQQDKQPHHRHDFEVALANPVDTAKEDMREVNRVIAPAN